MTRQIKVSGIPIGGGAPVVIQSMLNTKTTDVEGFDADLATVGSTQTFRETAALVGMHLQIVYKPLSGQVRQPSAV